MLLENGKKYRCKNGTVITVKKNHLPHYCFSVAKCHSTPLVESETWTKEGIAYHDDCGFNIVEEQFISD